MSGSLKEAHKVRPLRTVSALLTHASFLDGQKLEPQLLRWVDLRHDNLLLFYGAYISRALLFKDPHCRIGIVTNIDSRLYMVSE